MEEIWKDIEGYEGLYQVSNLGRVKSLRNLKTKKEKILKTNKNKCGYYYVNISKNNKSQKVKIHRLVAKEFIPNLDNKKEINHIDGNKENNRISNLEWCTRSENMQHAIKTGLGINIGRNKIKTNGKKVIQYNLNMKKIAEYPSIRKAGRDSNINYMCIYDCCNGKNKTAHGYIWKYANE